MPNHETSVVAVVGTREALDAFIVGAFSPNLTAPVDDADLAGLRLDFDKILPMPPEVAGTSSPTEVVATQAEADARNIDWASKFLTVFDGQPQTKALTQAQADARIAEHGALNWYDWSITNWGTKWNAYDQEDCERTTHPSAPSLAVLRLRFNTAWSAPHPIFEAIEEKYGVAVHAITLDEGGAEPSEYGDPGEYMSVVTDVQFY